jgi:16S rRNA (guanine966-N2)-methyltransferase
LGSFWGIKMRVIAGKSKGKKLKSPKGNTRPLSDQAKESLFNILQPYTEGSRFLDLFAGSGGVGIEAISRGAVLSVFVELDKKTVQVIRDNLALCGFTDKAEVYNYDVLRSVKILKRKEDKFDIIFIGAPYGSPALESVMEELSDGTLLDDGGIVIAEYRAKHNISEEFGKLKRVREARYGDTVLSFYENSNLSR